MHACSLLSCQVLTLFSFPKFCLCQKICSEEYDKGTCIFLGVQTEVSVILSDLTMVISLSSSTYSFAPNLSKLCCAMA